MSRTAPSSGGGGRQGSRQPDLGIVREQTRPRTPAHHDNTFYPTHGDAGHPTSDSDASQDGSQFVDLIGEVTRRPAHQQVPPRGQPPPQLQSRTPRSSAATNCPDERPMVHPHAQLPRLSEAANRFEAPHPAHNTSASDTNTSSSPRFDSRHALPLNADRGGPTTYLSSPRSARPPTGQYNSASSRESQRNTQARPRQYLPRAHQEAARESDDETPRSVIHSRYPGPSIGFVQSAAIPENSQNARSGSPRYLPITREGGASESADQVRMPSVWSGHPGSRTTWADSTATPDNHTNVAQLSVRSQAASGTSNLGANAQQRPDPEPTTSAIVTPALSAPASPDTCRNDAAGSDEERQEEDVRRPGDQDKPRWRCLFM